MRKFTLSFCACLCALFMLSSCYKHQTEQARNPDILFTKRGFYAEKMIPERDAIWGTLFTDVTVPTKVEYNLSSHSYTPMPYELIPGSYGANNATNMYSCKKLSGLNDIQIINTLDGSVLSTIHYNYFVNSCAVADSNLYVLEGTIGPSKLHVYNLFTNYAFDSLWVGNNAVNIAVSQDGSHIFTSTDLLSNTVYVSKYKKSDSTLSDIVVAKPSGEFSFASGTFFMSDNGKKVLSNSGVLFSDQMSVLHDFDTHSLPSFLSNDGSVVVFFQGKNADVYDANGYGILRTKLLPNFGGDNYSYSSLLPFYYHGVLYVAVNYADVTNTARTIITRL